MSLPLWNACVRSLHPCECKNCCFVTRVHAPALFSSAPLRDLLDAPTALAACCGFDLCHKYILYLYLYLYLHILYLYLFLCSSEITHTSTHARCNEDSTMTLWQTVTDGRSCGPSEA
jgi:hypothetical protein